MVLNNTKVFQLKMFGNKRKTDGTGFLLRELNAEQQRLWDVLVDQ
jgi:S-adenosylmethionine:tRNA-ribosyltransferase-isomerase (queuine synthetase)